MESVFGMYRQGDCVALPFLRPLVFLALSIFLMSTAANAAATSNEVGAQQMEKDRSAPNESGNANEVLQFAGVRSGSVVLDLVPHRLSAAHSFADKAGTSGHVYVFVPSEADAYLKAKYPNGLPTSDPAHANISYIHTSLAKVVAPQYLDVIWVGGSYHDFHNKFFALKNIYAVNHAAFELLKPGGVFVVMDNAAARGSGLRDTETLHRIDEEQVKREVLAAGFEFAGESRVLRSAADDHTSQVSDADVGAETDVFLLKFRKPD